MGDASYQFGFVEKKQTIEIELPGNTFLGFDIRTWSLHNPSGANVTFGAELADGTVISNLDFNLYFSDTAGSNSTVVDNSYAHWGDVDPAPGASGSKVTKLQSTGTPFNNGDYYIRSAPTSATAGVTNQSWGDLQFIVPGATASNPIKKILITLDYDRVVSWGGGFNVFFHDVRCASSF